MVNYLDSRRIMGTTAERSSIPVPATAGGWVELGRTTLGGTSDTIDVTSLADKRYYMTLCHMLPSGNITGKYRYNGDSGNNYADRYSRDGAGDTTNTSRADNSGLGAIASTPVFDVAYHANVSSKEKLFKRQFVVQNTAGATTAPSRSEAVGKHAQTSNPINQISAINTQTGDYASGSELVVLGWDESDTHTNNFWEELASVNASGSSTTLSSGTITAKKYLWIQTYLQNPDSPAMRFNSDSGSNYARRGSLNGATDYTVTSTTQSYVTYGGNPSLTNYFILNNASNEKLVIWHSVGSGTAGAANAPNRKEEVFKWTNTSNQITQIDLINSSANHDSSSIIKVWGAD